MKSKKINKILIILFSLLFSFACANGVLPKQNPATIYASAITTPITDYESVIEQKILKQEFANSQQIEIYANEHNYAYFEKDDCVCFYNRFALKTLIVSGEFDSSVFKNVKKVGKSITILYFDSVAETEQTYNFLLTLPNITVTIEQIIQSSVSDINISAQALGWGYNAIDVGPYQSYLTEENVDTEVVVAVIDTGINTSHTMLKDRILTDAEGNYVGLTFSQTTYTYSGYSFEDDNGHGTHVSGIICDTTPDNVKILPIKLLDKNGEAAITTTVYYNIFEQIEKLSATYNIVCVNMSLGGATSKANVDLVDNYMQELLVSNNILPIVAAGNEHTEIDNNYLPGCCPSAVTVSAIKQSGSSYEFDVSYSNYGSCVDVSAPGTSIRSAWINSTNASGSTRYKYSSGTSMATPYVSAVVALLCLDPIYADNPNLSTVEQRVYSLAVDLGDTGVDIYYGHGMLSLKGYKGGIEYTATNTTVNYDGEYHNISVSVTNTTSYSIKYGFAYDAINITNIVGDDTFKNWTNGAIKIYFLLTADNMTDTIGYATLQINKATRAISIDNQSGTYGETPVLNQTLYSLDVAPYGSDELGIVLYTNATESSGVGEYDIEYSWGNTNYQLNTAMSGKYTVGKRDLKIRLNSQNSIYGNTLNLDKFAYSVVSGSIVNDDDLKLEFITNATTSSPVGNYTLGLESWNECYNLTWITGNLQIIARPITISINQSKQYGDEINLDLTNFTVISGSVVNNDILLEELATTATTFSAVGEYAISITKANSNYSVSLESGILNVQKRLATVVVGNATNEYGEEITLIQTNYTASGVLAGDDLNVNLTTTATNKSAVGEYAINATASNANYFVNITKGVLTITTRAILIKYNQTFIYGDKIVIDTTLYIDVNSKLIVDDELNLILSTTARQYSSVDTYSVSIQSANRNYEPSLTDDSNIVILPRNIEASIGNATKKYGDNVNLNNVSVDLSQVLNNDKLNYQLTTTATKTSNIGNYDISMEYSNINYDVTVINGQYTVTARPVTLLVQTNLEYGETINLTNVNFTVNSGSVVEGDDLELVFSTNAVQYSIVGNYNLTLTSNNENYNITLNSASYLQIVARNITVKVGDAESRYGEEVTLAGVSVDTSEVVNGDDLGITLTTTATNTSPVGRYEISFYYTNTNYAVTIVNGVYRIYNKQVHVTIDPQSFVYGEDITLDQMAYSIAETDVEKADLELVLSTVATSVSSVGEYDITIASYADNFYVVAENGKLTITARAIEVKITQTVNYGDEFVYDGSFVDVSNRIVNNDVLDLEIQPTERTLYSPVGSYAFTVIDCNSNYYVTLSFDSILMVEPRPITVQIGNGNSVYSKAIQLSSVSVDLSQVKNEDDLNVELLTNASSSSDVGTYYIDLNYNNSNYTVTVQKGVYTITPYIVVLDVADFSTVYGEEFELPISLINCEDSSVDLATVCVELSTSANNRSSVGDYLINVGNTNPNYKVQLERTGYVKVVAKDVTLILGNAELAYGSTINLEGKVELISTGVLDGDDLSVELSTNATQTSPIGNYIITASCGNLNYNVAVTNGELKIVPKLIKIKVQQSGVYGDVHILNNDDFIDVENAVLAGDDLQLSLNFEVGQFDVVDTYTLNASCANLNYQVQLVESFYKITPRQISVGLGNTTIFYGDNVNENTISIDQTEVLNGDNLNIALIYNVTATTHKGVYTVDASYNNANYIVTFVQGQITVEPRPVTVLISAEMVYGDEVASATNFEIKNGQIVNNDDLALQIRMTVSRFAPVGGSYPIEIVSYNNNYLVTLDANSLTTVKPKPIIVTVGNRNSFYLDEIDLNNISIDLSQVYSQDVENLNYYLTTTATKTSDVGRYVINFNYDNDNYDITVQQGEYAIVAKPVNIVIFNNEVVYGDAIPTSAFDFVCYTADVVKANLQVELQTTAKQFDAVGKYPISVKSNNPNYFIMATNGKLTISPRKLTIKLNSQSKGHFTSLLPDQDAYEIIEGEVCKDDDLGVTINANTKYLFAWGAFKLTGKANNQNYQVEFVENTIIVSYSYVDTIIIVIIACLLILIVALVLARIKNRAKGNLQQFNDAIKLLKQYEKRK